MKLKLIISIAALAASILQSVSQTIYPYQNPSLSAEERAEDLCSRLTSDEKVKLMMDRSPEIKRLDIPAFE